MLLEQGGTQRPQERVAVGMPVLVVGALEPVHVDEGDDERLTAAGAPGRFPLQGDEAGAALHQPGEDVGLEDRPFLAASPRSWAATSRSSSECFRSVAATARSDAACSRSASVRAAGPRRRSPVAEVHDLVVAVVGLHDRRSSARRSRSSAWRSRSSAAAVASASPRSCRRHGPPWCAHTVSACTNRAKGSIRI